MKKGADSLPTQIAEYHIDFTAAKDTAYGRQLFYKNLIYNALSLHILLQSDGKDWHYLHTYPTFVQLTKHIV